MDLRTLAILLIGAATATFAGPFYTYTYAGNDFDSCGLGVTTSCAPSAPYSTSDSISGSFTLASPLGANISNVSVGPLSFSFSDGVTTTTNNTPGLINDLFAFYTNGVGNITYWGVAIVGPYQNPPTNTLFYDLVTVSCGAAPIGGRGGLGACTGVPLGPSYQILATGDLAAQQASTSAISHAGARANDPGSWTMSVSGLAGGTSSSPTYLATGPNITGVTGTIVGQGSQDYYLFHWNGGAFSATTTVTGADVNGSYLFSVGTAGACNSGGSQTLNSGDNFSSTISLSGLAAGNYCIGLDADSPYDPDFGITFNTPVGGATPEPGTFGMFFAGMGAMGFFRRLHLTARKR